MNGAKETTEMYDFLRLKLSKEQNPKVGASFSFLQDVLGRRRSSGGRRAPQKQKDYLSMPGLTQFPPCRLSCQVRKASVVKWPPKQKVLAAPGTGQEALPLPSVPEGGKRVLPCEPARRHARGFPVTSGKLGRVRRLVSLKSLSASGVGVGGQIQIKV